MKMTLSSVQDSPISGRARRGRSPASRIFRRNIPSLLESEAHAAGEPTFGSNGVLRMDTNDREKHAGAERQMKVVLPVKIDRDLFTQARVFVVRRHCEGIETDADIWLDADR